MATNRLLTWICFLGILSLTVILMSGCEGGSILGTTDSSSGGTGTSMDGGGTPTGDGGSTGGETGGGTTPPSNNGGGGGTPSWKDIGTPGFSNYEVHKVAFAADTRNGYLYVAYQDDNPPVYPNFPQGKCVIKRIPISGSTDWILVSTTEYDGSASIAVDAYGTLVVAFLNENSNPKKFDIKKFDGTNWYAMGTELDAAGQPIIALQDTELWLYLVGTTGSSWKFNTSSRKWESLGSFGATSGSCSFLVYSDAPYVAWNDGSMNGYISKHAGTWQQIGPLGAPTFGKTSGGSYTGVISMGMWYGDPCVAFKDEFDDIRVKKLYRGDSTYWEDLGTVGKSEFGYYGVVSLAVSTETIYVAYRDAQANGKLVVKKWNKDVVNPAWEVVGGEAASEGSAEYLSLIVLNNVPYVAFKDGANGGKVTVRKFE